MRKYKLNILPLLFLMVMFIYFAYNKAHKPRILIIQSHAISNISRASSEVDQAIRRELEKKSWINVRWGYILTEGQSLAWSVKQIRNIIRQWHPNVIVAIGDKAQAEIAKNYINDKKVKIVFSSIKNTYQQYGYDKAFNVTGIIEQTPFLVAKKIYANLMPDKKRVVVISDNSSESISMLSQFRKIDWQPFNIQKIKVVDSFSAWQKTIEQAQKQADAIFILHYTALEDNKRTQTHNEVIQWTVKNSRLPVLGFNGSFVEDGGPIAIGIDHREQGQFAAKIAIKMIESKSAKLPAIHTHTQLQPYIRQSVFKRYFPNTALPKLIVDFAKAQNSYYP